jgi:hypothetical protein
MSVNPIWPSGTSEIVLWLQLVCTWIIATYAIVFDWTRQSPGDPPPKREGFVLSIATLFAVVSGLSLPPWGTSICARLGLAAVGAALVAITGFLRRMLRSVSLGGHHWLAEMEVSANLVAVIATGAVIGLSQVGGVPQHPIVRGGKATAIFCLAAAAIFAFRGGTSIVRAVLDKMSAEPRLPKAELPANSGESRIDVKELNRGRSIGNLERLLMVIVVALGHYETLGFLIAAKGLIRSSEFQDRNFAEYFILGSLTSAVIAISIGIALRVVVPILWNS